MATQKENLQSPGSPTGIERNTFTRQRQNGLEKRPVLQQTDFSTLRRHQHLRAMQLQQRWQELKERELKAKQHNWQLMLQFEEAQNTLREMMTLTATMKTIRMEYERYLRENSPIWQQQLQEQTQAAQRKRMEDYLRSCLKNTQRMTRSSSELPQDPQGLAMKTQNTDPPQSQNDHLDYNQDGFPHLPFMQSSRTIHPQSQTAGFPIRVPHQPQHSSHTQPTFPQPQTHPFPHLASNLGPSPQVWGTLQPDCPWSSIADAAGLPSDFEALWGHLHREEVQAAEEKAETSRLSSSQRGDGRSRRSHSSQELDVKPVRLSSGHAESSESSKESDQASRESRRKRKEKRRAQHSSSERGALSSQRSSAVSGANIFAAATAQSSESDTSSGKDSSRGERRNEGVGVGYLKSEKEIKKRSRRQREESGSHKDSDQSFSEEVKSQTENSRNEKAGSRQSGSQMEEESVSVSVDIDEGSLKETEKEEGESSEQSSMGEKEVKQEEDLEDEDDVEKENSKIDEEQEERDEEGDEPSDRKNISDEDDSTGAEDEMEEQESEKEEDRLNGEDELRNQGSASSQDEEDSKEGQGSMEMDRQSEEEGRSDEEKEQKREKAGESEEEEDSDDSIIIPQENRTQKIYVIPEAVEDEEEDEEEEDKESKIASSDDNSIDDSDDDIEHLLAPKEELKDKENKEQSFGEKPKANGNKVEIFQVQRYESTKTDLQSDSDEFDHFYD